MQFLEIPNNIHEMIRDDLGELGGATTFQFLSSLISDSMSN